MFNLFQNIHIDWLGKRKYFIAFSILIMLAGLVSTIGRQYTPGGTEPLISASISRAERSLTAKFSGQRPSDDQIRAALHNAGVTDPVIQASTDKPDEVLIKIAACSKIPTDGAGPGRRARRRRCRQAARR